jgi:hypothetical protein
MTSRFKIKLYGFVKMEAIYDNAQVYQGDWILYVPAGKNASKGQNVFTMNARHTRFGLNIDGPTIGSSGKTKGMIEADFAGGFPNSSTAARQPLLRLRHAWMEIAYPKWELRIGQDWALIATPFPNSTSFVVGACLGNLWNNYSQIKYTYKLDPLKIAFSVNRPMAGDTKYNSYDSGDLDIVEDGEKSGTPWYMLRTWLKLGQQTVSVSAHYGQKAIADSSNKIHRMDSYSLNADAVITLKPVTFTVRGFYGENLNSFFGGILQGFTRPNATTVKNVASTGGWGQIVWNINESWATTAGVGRDDPNEDDLLNGMKSRNDWVFGNVSYDIKKTITFMLEGEHIKTYFKNSSAGENFRVQFASYYKF